MLEVRWKDGAEPFHLERGRRLVRHLRNEESARQSAQVPIVLVTALIVINVAFTRGGTLAHGLHPDSTRPIGPWVKFELAEWRDLLLPFVGRATGAGGLRTFGAVHEVHNIRVEETAHQLLHCALL